MDAAEVVTVGSYVALLVSTVFLRGMPADKAVPLTPRRPAFGIWWVVFVALGVAVVLRPSSWPLAASLALTAMWAPLYRFGWRRTSAVALVGAAVAGVASLVASLVAFGSSVALLVGLYVGWVCVAALLGVATVWRVQSTWPLAALSVLAAAGAGVLSPTVAVGPLWAWAWVEAAWEDGAPRYATLMSILALLGGAAGGVAWRSQTA